MKRVLFIFVACYLFTLTPIYKERSPAYFKKAQNFIDHMMSVEKNAVSIPSKPAQSVEQPISPAVYQPNNDPMGNKGFLSGSGYHKNY